MYSWQRSINALINKIKVFFEQQVVLAGLGISFCLHIFLFVGLYIMSFQKIVPHIQVKNHGADIPLVIVPPILPHTAMARPSQKNRVKNKVSPKRTMTPTQKKVQPQTSTASMTTPQISPAKKLVSQDPLFSEQKQGDKKQGIGKTVKGKKTRNIQESMLNKEKSQKNQLIKSMRKETDNKTKNEPPCDEKILKKLQKEASFVQPKETQEFPTQIPVSALDDEEIVENSSSYEPFYQLHQGFQAYWHPPLESDELHCSYRVFLTLEGTIEKIVVIQSSGVLIFDTAARAALMKITYPRVLWGKECVFTF